MTDLAIATKLIHDDSRHSFKFAILQGENHQFYAVRSKSPYFCFEADTIKDATDAALRAIDFYRSTQSNK